LKVIDAIIAAKSSYPELGWKKLLVFVNNHHGWDVNPTRFKALMKTHGLMHVVPEKKLKKVPTRRMRDHLIMLLLFTFAGGAN